MRQRVIKFQAKGPGATIDKVTINMPWAVEILKVSIAPDRCDTLNVHALVTEDGSGGKVTNLNFLIIGTGVEIPQDTNWTWVDTLIDGRLYWHVFVEA